MSLDRVLSGMKLPQIQQPQGTSSARYQRPALASTRAWIFDTEKLLQHVRYAERSSREMRGAATQVLSRDHKEAQSRGRTVDREVKSQVESTAMATHQLEKAIALHEAELVRLLKERTAARDALALILAPLEKVRQRIEVRLANPLPLEERTDTSVLESLQIVSRALADCSKMLTAYVKDAERHCTHMESLRQAIRLEISDRHESMRMTYANSHEVPVEAHGSGSSAGHHNVMAAQQTYGVGSGAPAAPGTWDDVTRNTEYARMLKSDMARCVQLSQAAISESVLLRSKLCQCVKDVTMVRKRNELLLNSTLQAHVRDTEMLMRTLSKRRAAVQAEIDQLKASESVARRERAALAGPAQMAHDKLRERVHYSRILRDGRAQDAVTMSTADESATLQSALKDAGRCESTLVRHRERLEGFLDQLSNAEKSKARVMQLAVATLHAGEKLPGPTAPASSTPRRGGGGGSHRRRGGGGGSARIPAPPLAGGGAISSDLSRRKRSSMPDQ